MHEYRQDGYLLLRAAIDPDRVLRAREAVLREIERSDLRSRPRQDNAYARAFIQIVNLGLSSPEVRAFTHDPGIASMAARLEGAKGLRIFVEDTFLKPVGAAHTPWHQDANAAPFETEHFITAWIPFQDVNPAMGTLRFVTGSHRGGLWTNADISEDSDRTFEELIRDRRLSIYEAPPLKLGDIHFHNGFTVHAGGPNRSSQERLALALHYFADGARIGSANRPQQKRILREFGPGLKEGDPAVSLSWPLVYHEGK